MFDSDEKTAVKSIYRAAFVLDCISNGTNSITEISESCHLSKSTVHRLLKALGESRLIIQDPTNRKYYLGYLITRLLSRPQITHEYLIRCAREEMKALADFSEETVYLGIMVALNYIGLHEIPSKNSLRVVEPEDRKIGPVHAGAGGKVLLSQLSSQELRLAMKHLVLEPLTDHTVTDKEELLAQIKRIKNQGYSISFNEIVQGVTCISAPIKNYGLPVVLSVIGPQERIRPNTNDFLAALLKSVGVISNNIEQDLKVVPT